MTEQEHIHAKSAVSGACGCGGTAAGSQSRYVYAVGRIAARFPSIGVEKEFRQACGVAGPNRDSGAELHHVLAHPANGYLARQLRWVFTIQTVDAFVLTPQDPNDYRMLIEAIHPGKRQERDLDVVIGTRSSPGIAAAYGDSQLPVVLFEQVYSFDESNVLSALCPDNATETEFRSTIVETLHRLRQLIDNSGYEDEHRALNYITTRYRQLYENVSRQAVAKFSLSSIEVKVSRLAGVRRIVDVIFTFGHHETDLVRKFFARVDVTEIFPFLVTGLQPYFERT